MDEIIDYIEFWLGELNVDAFIKIDDGRRLVIECDLGTTYRRDLQAIIYDDFPQVETCVVRDNYGGRRFITQIEVTI